MDVKQILIEAILNNDKVIFAKILEDPENVRQLDQKKFDTLLSLVSGKIHFETSEYEIYGLLLIDAIHTPIFVKQNQIAMFCRANSSNIVAHALEKMDSSDSIEFLVALKISLYESFLTAKNSNTDFSCSIAILEFIATKKHLYSRVDLDFVLSKFYQSAFEYGTYTLIKCLLTNFPAIDFEITKEFTLNTLEFVRLVRENPTFVREKLADSQREEIIKIINSRSALLNHLIELVNDELYDPETLIRFINTKRDEINYHFLGKLYHLLTPEGKYFFEQYSEEIGFIPPRLTNNLTIPKLARQQAYLMSLTKAQRELLIFYTSGELDSANKALFKNPEQRCDSLCKNIREIQRLISQSPPVEEEFIVYRGGSEDYNAFPGRAVVSTTTDVQVMFEFAKNKYGYKLHIKPGMRILPIYMISTLDTEFEILIDGELSEFEYVNGEYLTDSKIILFTLDVVSKEFLSRSV
jgi:hypothetical protein